MVYWLLTTYREIAWTTIWPSVCAAIVVPMIIAFILGRPGRKTANDLHDETAGEKVPLTIAGIFVALAVLHLNVLALGDIAVIRGGYAAPSGLTAILLGPPGYNRARLAVAGVLMLFTCMVAFIAAQKQVKDGGLIREFINTLRDPSRRRGAVGSAHFCSLREFARYRKPDKNGIKFLGAYWTQLPGEKRVRRLDTGGVMHVAEKDTVRGILTFGGPGSGKTQAVIKPTIYEHMSAGRPVIIVDPQGELTHDVLDIAPITGHLVVIHDPTSKEHARFNLVHGIDNVSDARSIADVLIPSANGDNKFWTDSAAALLAACLLRFSNLGEIYAAMASLKELGKSLASKRDDAFLLANSFIASLQSDGKVATNTVATLATALQGWADAVVRETTSNADFKASDLVESSQPIALVITCPGRQRAVFAPYLGAALSKIFLDLDTIGEQHGGPLPMSIGVVIDEFPTLGKLDRLVADVNLVRKRRIGIMIAAQTIGQLEMIYGKEGTDALLAGMGMQIVFGACDQATGEFVSRASGTATEKEPAVAGAAPQIRQRPLLTVDEVKQPLRGNCIGITRYVDEGFATQTLFFAQLTRFYQRQDIADLKKQSQAAGKKPHILRRPPTLIIPRQEEVPPIEFPSPGSPGAALQRAQPGAAGGPGAKPGIKVKKVTPKQSDRSAALDKSWSDH